MFEGSRKDSEPVEAARLSPNADFAGTIPFLLFALFQLKFAIITPALITGSMAGRVRFRAYILFMVLFALIVYPPLCHMT